MATKINTNKIEAVEELKNKIKIFIDQADDKFMHALGSVLYEAESSTKGINKISIYIDNIIEVTSDEKLSAEGRIEALKKLITSNSNIIKTIRQLQPMLERIERINKSIEMLPKRLL